MTKKAVQDFRAINKTAVKKGVRQLVYVKIQAYGLRWGVACASKNWVACASIQWFKMHEESSFIC